MHCGFVVTWRWPTCESVVVMVLFVIFGIVSDSFHRGVPRPLHVVYSILFLSLFHADKLFTPHHQRRHLPAEQTLSPLSSRLLSISPPFFFFTSSCLCFILLLSPLLSSCVHPHVNVSFIPSLVQNPRLFLRCIKQNKRPPFYVCSISFLFLFNRLQWNQEALIYEWIKKTRMYFVAFLFQETALIKMVASLSCRFHFISYFPFLLFNAPWIGNPSHQHCNITCRVSCI